MLRSVTAIHIDDEVQCLEAFREAAKEVPALSLSASFTHVDAALEYLKSHHVDIIFTDIEMPGKSGFWFADYLKGTRNVVFVTAHASYALKAFDAFALDYILKPVQVARLSQTVQNFWQNTSKTLSSQVDEFFRHIKSQDYPKRIFIYITGHIKIVQLDEVLYFAASGSYTKVYYKSGEILMSSKLIKTYIEPLVRHPDYVRIHRSFLVNKNYVVSLNRDPGKYSVTMSNGDMLDVSQLRKDEIFNLLLN